MQYLVTAGYLKKQCLEQHSNSTRCEYAEKVLKPRETLVVQLYRAPKSQDKRVKNASEGTKFSVTVLKDYMETALTQSSAV